MTAAIRLYPCARRSRRSSSSQRTARLDVVGHVFGRIGLGGFATEYLSPSGAILLDAMTFVVAALVASTLPSLKPQVDTEGTPSVGLADMKRLALCRCETTTDGERARKDAAYRLQWWRLGDFEFGRRAPSEYTESRRRHRCDAMCSGGGYRDWSLDAGAYPPRDPRVGSLVAFLGMALFIGFDDVWVSVIALALWGVGQGHDWVISTAEIQADTPDYLLGRVTAIDLCLLSLGGALAAVCAGFVSDTLGDPAAGAWVTFRHRCSGLAILPAFECEVYARPEKSANCCAPIATNVPSSCQRRARTSEYPSPTTVAGPS